jgi:hypothetical protein
MPRAAAFSSPSVTSRLRGLMSCWPGAAVAPVDVALVDVALVDVALDGVGLGDAVGRWVMTGFYDPVHGLEP